MYSVEVLDVYGIERRTEISPSARDKGPTRAKGTSATQWTEHAALGSDAHRRPLLVGAGDDGDVAHRPIREAADVIGQVVVVHHEQAGTRGAARCWPMPLRTPPP